MKLTIEVSAKNEATSAPWWCIIDPRQNMRCDVHEAAGQVDGPFFSRKDAQQFLDETRYNFSDRARVYCMSGCHSRKYADAYKKAEQELNK